MQSAVVNFERLSLRNYMGMTVLAILLCASLLWIFTYRYIFSPHEDLVNDADAIVLFAGGSGERLDLAKELLEKGQSEVLITNAGVEPWEGEQPVMDFCKQKQLHIRLVCLNVKGDTTEDEAREFSVVAKSMSLDSLMVVTGKSHLTRARSWMARCFPGEVYGVGAENSIYTRAVMHEWGGLVKYLLTNRSCKQ